MSNRLIEVAAGRRGISLAHGVVAKAGQQVVVTQDFYDQHLVALVAAGDVLDRGVSTATETYAEIGDQHAYTVPQASYDPTSHILTFTLP